MKPSMKQVIVELTEEQHAALKDRAALNLRKIPQQLLFEALQYPIVSEVQKEARQSEEEAT